MKYLRKWILPNNTVVHRYDEKSNAWSYFWYCFKCGEIYARAPAYVNEEEGTHPLPYCAVSGLCLQCPADKWHIPGGMETIRFVGWPVPLEVARYQLDCELLFLEHPDHPHNKGIENGSTAQLY